MCLLPAATLAASVNYPLRGAATFKSTVGTNVASDALANLASGGVLGGALIGAAALLSALSSGANPQPPIPPPATETP